MILNSKTMLVKTYAAAVQGISAIEVTIEVNVSPGIRFLMVGLPDNAVKESHERIYSALQYNGLQIVVCRDGRGSLREGAGAKRLRENASINYSFRRLLPPLCGPPSSRRKANYLPYKLQFAIHFNLKLF